MFANRLCSSQAKLRLYHTIKYHKILFWNLKPFSQDLNRLLRAPKNEPPQILKKVGAKTSPLDLNWSKNPNLVIKNANKLTEVELMNLLKKVVTLPEKRLDKILRSEGLNEEFIGNLIARLPHFMTDSIIQITKVAGTHKDLLKGNELWNHLELELLRRSSFINNQDLADILFAFASTGTGSEKFFNHFEEVIIDSPIPIETTHLFKMMKSFSQ